MRILFIVLTVLFVLGALATGGMLASTNLGEDAAAKIAEAQQTLANLEQMAAAMGAEGAPALEEARTLLKNAEGYKTSGVAGVVVVLLSLVLLGVSFTKNQRVALIAAGVSVLAVLVLFVVTPNFDVGDLGPASPRQQVLICAVPTVLAALFAFLAAKKGAANAKKPGASVAQRSTAAAA